MVCEFLSGYVTSPWHVLEFLKRDPFSFFLGGCGLRIRFHVGVFLDVCVCVCVRVCVVIVAARGLLPPVSSVCVCLSSHG